MINELIGKHGYSGACLDTPLNYGTVSVSFYRIENKSSKKGTKRVPVHYRLRGECLRKNDIISRAEEIVEQLNNGWIPSKKSETLK